MRSDSGFDRVEAERWQFFKDQARFKEAGFVLERLTITNPERAKGHEFRLRRPTNPVPIFHGATIAQCETFAKIPKASD